MRKILLLAGFILSPVVFSQTLLTQTRNDAGAPTAASGFYEAQTPVNYPLGATNFWHLLDVRHSNPNNNYGMQFSGSFYDQELWFRKTNNNSTQPWSKVITQSSEGKVKIGLNDPETASVSLLRVYSQDSPMIELANSFGKFQIAKSGCNGCYGANAGETILRNNGGSHTIILALPNNNNDGTSYIGIQDGTRGTWVKFLNNGTARIDGKVYAKEVEVKANVWADYVFKKDYKLKPLEEVEKHITEKGYLPNIPPAAEVIEKGINVAEMDAKLLEKIEELTLYSIEQNKQIKQLQEENKVLKSQSEDIIELKKQVQGLISAKNK